MKFEKQCRFLLDGRVPKRVEDRCFARTELWLILFPLAVTSQPTQDQEHIRLLVIFHYIVGALAALVACFPLFPLVLGLGMIFMSDSQPVKPNELSPGCVAWIGGVMFLFGQAIALCIYLVGRFLERQRRYRFIFVMACIECVLFPVGTLLGVLTILILLRTSVKTLFGITSSVPSTA